MQPREIQITNIHEGLDRKDLSRLRDRFMIVNQQRFERCLSRLTVPQQKRLSLLPLLLHVNHALLPGYTSHETPAGISQYTPSPSLIRSMQGAVRGFHYEKHQSRHCEVASVFIMGSTGSLAHTHRSDIDVWVCTDISPDSHRYRLLRKKLDGIERWLAETHLESHFFIVRPEDVRRGHFGELSLESSGSTQHFLLLDEFYRSAILLAGRYPLWWLIPAETDDYTHFAETLLAKRFVKADAVIDFGGMPDNPASEFVGAGLWQLYKGIDSPFKSLLKMLLIEAYVNEHPHIQPVAHDFKQAIYQNRLDINDLDPYVLVYRKIERYLKAQLQFQRLELARLCFYFKVGIPLSRTDTSRKHWQRQACQAIVSPWQWGDNYLKHLDERDRWKATEVIPLNQSLVNELKHSYKYISSFARNQKIPPSISQQDLDKLGRKLYANFEKRQHKVERITLAKATGSGFDLSEARLLLQRKQADPPRWELLVLHDGKEPEALKQADSAMHLFCWAVLNRILVPQTRIDCQIDNATSTLPARSLCKLLQRHLLPDHNLAPDFSKDNTLTHILVFVNTEESLQSEYRKHTRISEQTDPLRFSGLKRNLAFSFDLVTRNRWGETYVHSFHGDNALASLLKRYLQLCTDISEAGPEITVESLDTHHRQRFIERLGELFLALRRGIQSCLPDQTFRYLLQQESAYLLLSIKPDGTTAVDAFADDPTLEAHLHGPQPNANRLLLDPHLQPSSWMLFCLQHSVSLRPAGQLSIDLYYQIHNKQAHLVIIDEQLGLYTTHNPYISDSMLLLPLKRFLQNVIDRKASLSGFTIQATTFVSTINLFQVSRMPTGRYQCTAQETPAQYRLPVGFDIQAEITPSGNQSIRELVLRCNEEEFSASIQGESYLEAFTNYVLALRKHRDFYPIYITDMIINDSQEANAGCWHYLSLKEQVEAMINKFCSH